MRCVSMMSVPRNRGSPKDRILVPCGKCIACRINRQVDWSVRLLEESKVWDNTKFITLTYSDENLPRNVNTETGEVLATLDKGKVQKVIKQVRAEIYPERIRYFVLGEYGPATFRPHYHMFLFSNGVSAVNAVTERWSKIGYVRIGSVTESRAMYISKYHVIKLDYPDGADKPFTMMSLKPGIGSSYVEKMEKFHRDKLYNAYYPLFDVKMRIPRYLKEKLYDKEQRDRIKSMFYDEKGNPTEWKDELREIEKDSNYFRNRLDEVKNFERAYKKRLRLNGKI